MIDQEITLTDKRKDWLSVGAILSILLIRFHQTIFFNQPISKTFLITHWDSIFASLKSGQGLGMDCSMSELIIPYRFFVSALWHYGLPLWNHLNGFGTPLLADPQAATFSPLYALFYLFPSMATWNLLLVLKLAIAAISTYYLCREIKFGFTVGLIAALLFIFCPYLQWQLELLGTGFCLVPLVFLFFTRMANKGSFWNIVFAGLIATIDISSAHPEMAFVTILFASIWTCFCCYVKDPYGMLSWLRVAVVRLSLVGLITLGLCAPVLIPFAEYIANAESYKLDVIAAAGLSWQALLANYLFPFQSKASIFFGPLSAWGLLASFVFFNKYNRFAKPLFICIIISLIGIIRPFPFNLLFHIPPLSMTFATYWLPEYLLFTSIIGGLGCSYLLEELFADTLIKSKTKMFVLIVAGIALLCIPLINSTWHSNNINLVFDQTFESPHFNFKVWISNASFTIFSLLALIVAVNRSQNTKIIASVIFVTIGLATNLLISLNSLPVRPAFEYPKKLKFSDGQLLTANPRTDRILSIGRHLFVPNNNLIYNLPAFRDLNPIFPKGFIGFSKACGVSADQYTQVYSPLISPLLSFAGVNKIISEDPIIDETALETKINKSTTKQVIRKTNPIIDTVNFENILSLNNIKLFRDDKNSSLLLRANTVLKSPENYHFCLSIEDLNGKPTTYVEPISILSTANNERLLCSAQIPNTNKNWQVSIRAMRDKNCTFLTPTGISTSTIRPDKSVVLATSKDAQLFQPMDNSRFKLIANHNKVFEYKDTKALPRHFFINKISWSANDTAALQFLKEHKQKLADVAVLEQKDAKQFNSATKTLFKSANDKNTSQTVLFEKGSVEPINKSSANSPTEFSLETITKAPSFLVSSEIYYPGWNVYIDGKQSNIFRTDYLFRGVIIPAGKHLIRFAYQPISLTIGLWLFFIK
jgi:hypothetical protein